MDCYNYYTASIIGQANGVPCDQRRTALLMHFENSKRLVFAFRVGITNCLNPRRMNYMIGEESLARASPENAGCVISRVKEGSSGFG